MPEFDSSMDMSEDIHDINLSNAYRVSGTNLGEASTHLGLRSANGSFHIIDVAQAEHEAAVGGHRRWAGDYDAWEGREEVAAIVSHPDAVDPAAAATKIDAITSRDHALWVVTEPDKSHEGGSLRAAQLIGAEVIGGTVQLVVSDRDGNAGVLNTAGHPAKLYVQPKYHAA